MLKKIIAALLCVLPILTIAQTEPKVNNEVAVFVNYYNRDCFGGIGSCSDSELIVENNKPNAIFNKINSNPIAITIDQFSVEELEKLKK